LGRISFGAESQPRFLLQEAEHGGWMPVAETERWLSFSPLLHSMVHFYSPEELAEITQHPGFYELSFNRMLSGAAAIHKAINQEDPWRGV